MPAGVRQSQRHSVRAASHWRDCRPQLRAFQTCPARRITDASTSRRSPSPRRAKSVADGVEAKKLPLAETPIFLVCAWAVYQTFVKNTNKMPLVSKGIMLGEAAHSGWKLIVRLLKTGQKKLG